MQATVGVCSLLVDAEDAPASAETLVAAAVEHSLDAHLAQRRGAHDAGLHGHVERRVRQGVFGMGRGELRICEYGVDSFELCMSCGLE